MTTKKKASKKASEKSAPKVEKKATPLIVEGQVYHPPGYRTVWVPETQSYRHVPVT